jgi:hypothetical protein
LRGCAAQGGQWRKYGVRPKRSEKTAEHGDVKMRRDTRGGRRAFQISFPHAARPQVSTRSKAARSTLRAAGQGVEETGSIRTTAFRAAYRAIV